MLDANENVFDDNALKKVSYFSFKTELRRRCTKFYNNLSGHETEQQCCIILQNKAKGNKTKKSILRQ